MPAPADVETLLVLIRPLAQDGAIDPDTPLLSTGILDSFALAELLDVLAAEFEIELPVEEVGVDNADTADQLLALLRGRG
jgi:acyl carrier protein